MNWLCIIPARGGSKGIPGKNIALVEGRPLISYTLDVASMIADEHPSFEVFVSTDSNEIKSVAEADGISVPFLRPAEIAGDHSKSIDFVSHTLDWYGSKGRVFDAVILLQPTSPLRSGETVRTAVNLFENAAPEVDSLITVCPYHGVPLEILYSKNDGGSGEPVLSTHGSGSRRQDREAFYVRNGAIYISRVSFVECEKRIIGSHPLLLEMSEEDSINIDTPADLENLRSRLSHE